jgi:hypothetical protein
VRGINKGLTKQASRARRVIPYDSLNYSPTSTDRILFDSPQTANLKGGFFKTGLLEGKELMGTKGLKKRNRT